MFSESPVNLGIEMALLAASCSDKQPVTSYHFVIAVGSILSYQLSVIRRPGSNHAKTMKSIPGSKDLRPRKPTSDIS